MGANNVAHDCMGTDPPNFLGQRASRPLERAPSRRHGHTTVPTATGKIVWGPAELSGTTGVSPVGEGAIASSWPHHRPPCNGQDARCPSGPSAQVGLWVERRCNSAYDLLKFGLRLPEFGLRNLTIRHNEVIRTWITHVARSSYSASIHITLAKFQAKRHALISRTLCGLACAHL